MLQEIESHEGNLPVISENEHGDPVDWGLAASVGVFGSDGYENRFIPEYNKEDDFDEEEWDELYPGWYPAVLVRT